jgi:2'-5' RNA ligase
LTNPKDERPNPDGRSTDQRKMAMDTIGIVSNIEGQPYRDIKRLWTLFERRYDSRAVRAYSHPHICYQAAKTSNVGQLKRDFQQLISQIRPFEIDVDGFRHFRKDVIYLGVRKTRELTRTHKVINRFLEAHCQDLFELYFPEHWIPHITLAMEDLTEDNFKKAWREFQGSDIRYKQRVRNICMVKWYPDGKIKIVRRYEL